jgi:TonB family protein
MKSFDYVEIIEWKYDSSGNCNKKTVSYVLKNMPTGTDTEYYDYELNGNLLKVEKYRNNELYEAVECKYDTRGNLIEKILYLGGVKIPIKRTEYNIVYSDDEMVFEQQDYCLEDLDIDSLVGNNDNEDEFVKVERMPSFAGGDLNTFRQWFGSEFKYPAIAAENGIQGRLIVKFVVEKDGRLTNIEFLQSPDPVFEEEVIRVLKKSPKWTPGYQQGKPCRVSYVLPIDIRLQ